MNATGESVLHSYVCLAPHPPLPQERTTAEICWRPLSISPVAFRSQEAVRTERAQLYGNLQSHAPSVRDNGDVITNWIQLIPEKTGLKYVLCFDVFNDYRFIVPVHFVLAPFPPLREPF